MTNAPSLPLGTPVSVLLTCGNDHQWRARGTAGKAGSIHLGKVSAPGGADDPMFCGTCGELMTQVLLVIAVGQEGTTV